MSYRVKTSLVAAFLALTSVASAQPFAITRIDPTEVSYLGKTRLAVFGRGFTPATSVVIDGITIGPASFSTQTNEFFDFTAPPHAPTTAPLDVRVVDPVRGEATLAGALRYVGPLAIASVTPRKVGVGRGETVIVEGAGFTQDTRVEIGGVDAPIGTFLGARALFLTVPDFAAGVYDVDVVDAENGGEVRARLAGGLRYLVYEEGDPSYRLRFGDARRAGGATAVEVILDELRNVAPGTTGYSLSVAVEGDCVIGAASTEGTVAAPEAEGGLFRGGFELTQLVDEPGARGIVHAIIFSIGRRVTLDPEESPHHLLDLLVRPGRTGCASCSIEFRDGLPSTFGPVANLITYENDQGFAPELGPGVDVECPTVQKPGDVNQDGALDISDGVALLRFLFIGAGLSLPCGDGSPSHPSNDAILDANGDGRLDVSDTITLLSFLFLGGPPHALGSECVDLPECRPGPFCQS